MAPNDKQKKTKTLRAHQLKRYSPDGIVAFSYIDEPDYEYHKELGEYQISLLIKAEQIGSLKDDIDLLIASIKAEVRSNSIPKESYPYEILHSGTVQKYADITGVEGSAGDMLLKARTKAHFKDKQTGLLKPNPIKCFDDKGNLMEQKQVSLAYRGSEAKVLFNLFGWNFGGKVGCRVSLFEVHFLNVLTQEEFLQNISGKTKRRSSTFLFR